MNPVFRAILSALMMGLGLATASHAEYIPDRELRPLTGVLKRIKASGVVRIGYREQAIPFSFRGPDGRPYGYSIDICDAIVEDLAAAVGLALLRSEYRRVTPADRIDLVADGQIDLECGSTSQTAERRQRVAFSPLIFIAGTRLLVKRDSPVRSERDLNGRKVVVARATTNETAMRALAERHGYTLTVAGDYREAFELLGSGRVDVLAADDILLEGYLSEQGLRGQYSVVGDLLSYEPYGIIFAKDDGPLAEVVMATFRRLAQTREIRLIYNKWFRRSLPSGLRLDLPMAPRLERSFQVLGLPD